MAKSRLADAYERYEQAQHIDEEARKKAEKDYEDDLDKWKQEKDDHDKQEKAYEKDKKRFENEMVQYEAQMKEHKRRLANGLPSTEPPKPLPISEPKPGKLREKPEYQTPKNLPIPTYSYDDWRHLREMGIDIYKNNSGGKGNKKK